jgi:2-oxoglutarate dehydrogenase E1 component
VRRVVLCSGKISPEAAAARDAVGAPAAVVRVEQLFPWPAESLDRILEAYPNCDEIFWLQEEPENMGPWNFVKGHLFEPYEDTHRIQRISRYASGSPAAGMSTIHAQEQAELLERAFAGL